jgi:hypothetical protein
MPKVRLFSTYIVLDPCGPSIAFALTRSTAAEMDISAQTTTHDHTSDWQASSPPQNALREGGYGWVCVVCTFFINAHTWGINSV